MAAPTLAATRSSADLKSAMEDIAAQDAPPICLFLPGNTKAAAIFHIGVIQALAKRGLLGRVKQIATRGYNATLAVYLSLHWADILQKECNDEIWVQPCLGLLGFPSTATAVVEQERKVYQRLSFSAVFQQEVLHDAPHCVFFGDAGQDSSNASVHCYTDTTFEADVTVQNALARIQTPHLFHSGALHFKDGAPVFPDYWEAIHAAYIDPYQHKYMFCICSLAIHDNEWNLMNRTRLDVWKEFPKCLWITVPFHHSRSAHPKLFSTYTHEQRFEQVVRFPVTAFSYEDEYASWPPIIANQLVQWGRYSMRSKLTRLGTLDFSARFTHAQRCAGCKASTAAMHCLTDDILIEAPAASDIFHCAAVDAEVLRTEACHKRLRKWDEAVAERAHKLQADHIVSAKDVHTLSSRFQEFLQDDERLSEQDLDTMSLWDLASIHESAHEKTPTRSSKSKWSTFCSSLFGGDSKSDMIPPPLSLPPAAAALEDDDTAINEDYDKEDNVGYDSLYFAVANPERPSHATAIQALQNRNTILQTMLTPRYNTAVIDFTATKTPRPHAK